MFETKAVIKKSRKTGKEYTCLEIIFPNGYSKLVLLDKAEEYICQPYAENNK